MFFRIFQEKPSFESVLIGFLPLFKEKKFSTAVGFNRGPKKFSLCLNSKSMREKREGGKGKTQ